MALLLLSQGVPMIRSGDEVLHSQFGNNNVYCQDNALAWFDWRLVETHGDMLRFVRELIAFRKRHPSLRRRRFLTGRPAPGASLPDVTWHGEHLHNPPWREPDARALAFTLAGTSVHEEPLHVVLNMSDNARVVALPAHAGCVWHRAFDTALPPPQDIVPRERQTHVDDGFYVAQPRSVAVLEAH